MDGLLALVHLPVSGTENSSRRVTVVSILLGILGLAALVSGAMGASAEFLLQKNGMPHPATVQRVSHDKARTTEVVAAGGRVLTYSPAVGSDPSVGDVVIIHYDPDNPSNVREAAEGFRLRKVFVPLMSLAVIGYLIHRDTTLHRRRSRTPAVQAADAS